ncbi:MAG: hypothetical protein AAF346_08345 [Pseudomonadota bacterium]
MKHLIGLPLVLAFLAMPQVNAIIGVGSSTQAAPVGALGGSWSGGGRLNLKGGKSERLRCRAYYTPKNKGAKLGMAIRCASPSYKIEIRSKLDIKGKQVNGSWEERNFNATGSLSGTSRPGRLALSINGAVRAGLFLTYSGSRQNVRLTGNFGSFRSLLLTLRK